MDTVRFGRVLGHGARQAAKTLVSAVDAATAPNPAPPSSPRPQPPSTSAAADSSLPRPAYPPTPTILPPAPAPRLAASRPAATATRGGLAEGSRRFGRAVWGPAVRLSGVLWLELTGVFFGLFALVAAIATWHLRFALHAFSASPGIAASTGVSASDDRTRLLFAAGMVVVFGYFSLSSFLKANRRSRRP